MKHAAARRGRERVGLPAHDCARRARGEAHRFDLERPLPARSAPGVALRSRQVAQLSQLRAAVPIDRERVSGPPQRGARQPIPRWRRQASDSSRVDRASTRLSPGAAVPDCQPLHVAQVDREWLRPAHVLLAVEFDRLCFGPVLRVLRSVRQVA